MIVPFFLNFYCDWIQNKRKHRHCYRHDWRFYDPLLKWNYNSNQSSVFLRFVTFRTRTTKKRLLPQPCLLIRDVKMIVPVSRNSKMKCRSGQWGSQQNIFLWQINSGCRNSIQQMFTLEEKKYGWQAQASGSGQEHARSLSLKKSSGVQIVWKPLILLHVRKNVFDRKHFWQQPLSRTSHATVLYRILVSPAPSTRWRLHKTFLPDIFCIFSK